LKNLQTGPIYHIFTPRKGIPLPTDAYSGKMIYAEFPDQDSNRPGELDRQFLGHIDAFNHDIKILTLNLKEKIDRIESSLTTEHLFPKDNDHLHKIARCHAVADTMATHFQTRRFFALKVLLVLAVIAFMFFQVYVEFWNKPAILLLYPVTIGIGALWFIRAHRKRYEQKHEDYRALSEAFRVQFFLSIADKKARVAEYYLQKHKGELEWIIYALRASLLRNWITPDKDMSLLTGNYMEKYSYINEHWVADQLAYYKKTSKTYHQHLENLKRTANRFFFGALGAAVTLFLISILIKHLPSFIEHDEKLYHSVLVVCTHSFLVISAAILGYNEKMVFAEQSKTFQQMVQLFNIAHIKLTKAIESNNPEEAREIIWELALESLMENADWLLLHRSRPMEMPKG
jgi:Ca2+/Na+ antiporter